MLEKYIQELLTLSKDDYEQYVSKLTLPEELAFSKLLNDCHHLTRLEKIYNDLLAITPDFVEPQDSTDVYIESWNSLFAASEIEEEIILRVWAQLKISIFQRGLIQETLAISDLKDFFFLITLSYLPTKFTTLRKH